MIYSDAVEDVMEMREHLRVHFGVSGIFVVQGRSMGTRSPVR